MLLGVQKCLAETELGLKMVFLSGNLVNFISISYITKYALTALPSFVHIIETTVNEGHAEILSMVMSMFTYLA